MTSNIPTLYKNVMDGLATEIGKAAFLWATDRSDCDRNCYRAEEYAHEVERLIVRLPEMIAPAQHKLGEHEKFDLLSFTLKRHANWRWGGNVSPHFLKT